MSALADSLRRARELYLSTEHLVCGIAGWVDWLELALEAAGGDRGLATRILELLDAVAPGEECATIRLSEEKMTRWQRQLEATGEWPPPDPSTRIYEVGMVFDFFAQGSIFLAEDSPEAKYQGQRCYRLHNRRTAEVAAVIGKACALAEAMPEPPKRRFTPLPVPVAAPVANVAVAVVRPMARDAGFVLDPEEERDDA